MKIQCPCGAKYTFEVTPEMARQPVQFVCSACGLDSSEFVATLVRQELGGGAASSPAAPGLPAIAPPPAGVTASPRAIAPPLAAATAPPPVRSGSVGRPAPGSRLRIHTEREEATPQLEAPPPEMQGQYCSKHPGEEVTEKCYVCSKPICPKCMELFGYVCSPLCKAKAESHGVQLPVYENQKSVKEARLWRRTVYLATAACVALVLLAGFWGWYAWFGSLPKTAFSVRFGEPAYSGFSAFAGKDQIVFLHGGTLARHDMKEKKEIWSHYLVDNNEVEKALARLLKQTQAQIERANNDNPDFAPKMPDPVKLKKSMLKEAAASLELRVVGNNIWIMSPGKLTRYDWDTGKPVKEIPLQSGFGNLIRQGDELLLVDNQEPGKKSVTRINLNTCESRTEEIGGSAKPDNMADKEPAGMNPKTGNRSGASRSSATAGLPVGMPGKDTGTAMDPAKVAEQAQHLSLPAKIALPAVLANSMNQERTLKELNDDPNRRASSTASQAAAGESFSLIPSKEGFIAFSTRLLESKIVTRAAMRAAPQKSVLDGAITASKSTEAANEILNDMQRSRGGDVIEEDESRYLVKIRRPDGADEWSGEVIGPPTLYPLETVNVLAANKLVIVFDKSNKKLWQSPLTYNVVGGPAGLEDENAGYGQGPCVERKDALYIFDQGVLAAFDKATGNVRWRLPSVGIAGLFFDDQGMIYMNTTDAGPETIKYSRQIDVSQKVGSIVVKVDPKKGKTLWSAQPGGQVNYVSGKFIYAVQSYNPGDEDEGSPYTVETGFETAPYLRIKRINPKDGKVMWEHFQQRCPLDVEFDKDAIRLVFKKEVQVLRFLTF